MCFKQKLGVLVRLLSTRLAPRFSSMVPGPRDQGGLSMNRSVIKDRQQLSPRQNKAGSQLGGEVLSPNSVQLSGCKAEKQCCHVATGELQQWLSEDESLRMGQSEGRSGRRGAILQGSPIAVSDCG